MTAKKIEPTKIAKLSDEEFMKVAEKSGQTQQPVGYLLKYLFTEKTLNDPNFSVNDLDNHMVLTKYNNGVKFRKLLKTLGVEKVNGVYHLTKTHDEMYTILIDELKVAELMHLHLYARCLKAMLKAKTSNRKTSEDRREYLRRYMRKYRQRKQTQEKTSEKAQEARISAVLDGEPKEDLTAPHSKSIESEQEPKQTTTPEPAKTAQNGSDELVSKLQKLEQMDVMGGQVIKASELRNWIIGSSNAKGTIAEAFLMLAKRSQQEKLEGNIVQTIKVSKGSLEKSGVDTSIKQEVPSLSGILKPYEKEYGESMNGQHLYYLRTLELLALQAQGEN